MTSRKTKEFLADNASWLTVEPLPGYAPEPDPVEQCWAWIKNGPLANYCAATLAELTAMLRIQVTAYPDDPRAAQLVGELAVHSAEFATLWARHDVEEPKRGRMRLIHPLVGELVLDWDAYPMPGAPGPILLVCTAEESSIDAERLQLLAGLLGRV